MNSSHTISVALCTHNGAGFLGEQVRSICEQTLLPAEIVLSDDDSIDDSVQIVQDILAQCLPASSAGSVELRVLRNRPALRVTKNFEQAVRNCRGDLIALCDQDDSWAPDRLETMAAEFARRPELSLMHSDARLVDARGQGLGGSLFSALAVRPGELSAIHMGNAFDVLMRRNLVNGATTMFRRSLLEQALPFPVEWLHDEWLGIIAAATGQVDVIERQLIEYRQHASNQVGVKRDTFWHKVGRALPARGNLQRLRAVKARRLLERLQELGVAVEPRMVESAASKLEHHLRRSTLPDARWQRVLPVLAEVRTGRYGRFDAGAVSILRDLVECV